MIYRKQKIDQELLRLNFIVLNYIIAVILQFYKLYLFGEDFDKFVLNHSVFLQKISKP